VSARREASSKAAVEQYVWDEKKGQKRLKSADVLLGVQEVAATETRGAWTRAHASFRVGTCSFRSVPSVHAQPPQLSNAVSRATSPPAVTPGISETLLNPQVFKPRSLNLTDVKPYTINSKT